MDRTIHRHHILPSCRARNRFPDNWRRFSRRQGAQQEGRCATKSPQRPLCFNDRPHLARPRSLLGRRHFPSSPCVQPALVSLHVSSRRPTSSFACSLTSRPKSRHSYTPAFWLSSSHLAHRSDSSEWTWAYCMLEVSAKAASVRCRRLRDRVHLFDGGSPALQLPRRDTEGAAEPRGGNAHMQFCAGSSEER